MNKDYKKTIELAKQDKFVSELLKTAITTLDNINGPYQDIPLKFHELIRLESFSRYRTSLPVNKTSKILLAEFYMDFEYVLREAISDKIQADIDQILKSNRFFFIDGFLDKKVAGSFEKTQEAQNLALCIYNWKILVIKITNLIYQIDFYAFSLNTKFKKKLMVKSITKPNTKLSYNDWAYVVMLKIVGLVIESIQIPSFSKTYTNPVVQQITLFLLATALGQNASSIINKASRLTSAVNLSFIVVLVANFNKFFKNPLLDKITSKEMITYAKVALEKILEVNKYMDQLVYDLELGLDNYNHWVIENDDVKSNDAVVKIARYLEFFITYASFDINEYKKDVEDYGLVVEQYDNKWLYVYEKSSNDNPTE